MDLETMIDKTAIIEGINDFGEGVLIGPCCSITNVRLGKEAKLFKYVNAYGCAIGQNTKVGAFTEIQAGATIGNNTIISSHSFICDKVTIGDNVFVGHGVMTINDLFPPSRKRTGTVEHWKPTTIGNKVIIGSNATLFPVKIGDNVVIGAGSVVRRDVPAGQVWAGNPAKYICDTNDLKYENGEPVFR